MGKRKFNLESSGIEQVFILGIASHETDYRLAWILNQGMGWKLSQEKPLILPSKTNPEKYLFPRFTHKNSGEISYTLIANHTSEKILLEEWRTTDFLLLVSGDLSLPIQKTLTESIRKLPDILMVFEIPFTKKIKNLEIF